MLGFRRYLLFILKKRPLTAIGACLIGVLATLFAAGLYGVSSFIISLAALHPTYDLIVVPAVLVRFLGLGRAVLAYLERYVSHNETFRLLSEIRVFVYDSLMPLVPGRDDRLDRGHALSMAVSDVELLQDGLLRIVYPMAAALLAVVTGTAVSYLLSPTLAPVFFLLALPLPFVLFGLTAAATRGRQKAYDEKRAALYGALLELNGGLTDIKTNTCQASKQTAFSQLLDQMVGAQKPVNRAAALSDAAAVLYTGVSLICLLAAAGALCAAGRLSGTLLAATVVGLATMTDTVGGLSTVGARFERVKNAAQRIFLQPAKKVAKGPSLHSAYDRIFYKKLTLDNISFSYPGRRLLENISFTLETGAPIVITGKSGRGKSTLADVMLGFATPDSGTITADGIALSAMTEEYRLTLFSVAEQTPHFFNDTLRANLLTTDKETPEAQLWEVLTAVGLDGLIARLPNGLDTYVFESGDNFSGGELQRLGIARALLKDAPFFIFDEPTAGLDQLNERRILSLIASISKTRGVMLITHRMSGELRTFKEIHIS